MQRDIYTINNLDNIHETDISTKTGINDDCDTQSNKITK